MFAKNHDIISRYIKIVAIMVWYIFLVMVMIIEICSMSTNLSQSVLGGINRDYCTTIFRRSVIFTIDTLLILQETHVFSPQVNITIGIIGKFRLIVRIKPICEKLDVESCFLNLPEGLIVCAQKSYSCNQYFPILRQNLTFTIRYCR
jgi:hypothetical protein